MSHTEPHAPGATHHDKPTVFVVDDDPAMQKSLARTLESEGYAVEAHESAESFLRAFRAERHGVILLDVKMEGMDGLELHETLRRRGVATPVIFISGHGTVPISVAAMRHGALDFLEKPFSAKALFDQVRRGVELDRKAREQAAERNLMEERLGSLTRREAQIVQLVVEGLTSNEIGEKLGISPKTVSLHRAHFMRKLGVACVADLVRMEMERRRLEPAPGGAGALAHAPA